MCLEGMYHDMPQQASCASNLHHCDAGVLCGSIILFKVNESLIRRASCILYKDTLKIYRVVIIVIAIGYGRCCEVFSNIHEVRHYLLQTLYVYITVVICCIVIIGNILYYYW